MTTTIPEQELKDINTALNGGHGNVQSISKGPSGGVISAKNEQVNPSGYKVVSFIGRRLKHQISVVTQAKHIIVAEAGQLYDDIPLDKRNMVVWFEHDFQ